MNAVEGSVIATIIEFCRKGQNFESAGPGGKQPARAGGGGGEDLALPAAAVVVAQPDLQHSQQDRQQAAGRGGGQLATARGECGGQQSSAKAEGIARCCSSSGRPHSAHPAEEPD